MSGRTDTTKSMFTRLSVRGDLKKCPECGSDVSPGSMPAHNHVRHRHPGMPIEERIKLENAIRRQR